MVFNVPDFVKSKKPGKNMFQYGGFAGFVTLCWANNNDKQPCATTDRFFAGAQNDNAEFTLSPSKGSE